MVGDVTYHVTVNNSAPKPLGLNNVTLAHEVTGHTADGSTWDPGSRCSEAAAGVATGLGQLGTDVGSVLSFSAREGLRFLTAQQPRGSPTAHLVPWGAGELQALSSFPSSLQNQEVSLHLVGYKSQAYPSSRRELDSLPSLSGAGDCHQHRQQAICRSLSAATICALSFTTTHTPHTAGISKSGPASDVTVRGSSDLIVQDVAH